MAKRYVHWLVGVIILICGIVFFLIYTRPQTIEQRYPMLSLSNCTKIKGYFFIAPGVEDTAFSIETEDSRFTELIQLIQSVETKKKLRNLLPQGHKTHLLSDGDFKWEVMLHFDGVSLPDGSQVSGEMLHLRNFFGDFSISFNGNQVSYSVSNQEQWLQDIMNVIALE